MLTWGIAANPEAEHRAQTMVAEPFVRLKVRCQFSRLATTWSDRCVPRVSVRQSEEDRGGLEA